MLTASRDADIFCTEAMLDTVPAAPDGPTAMEDVKAGEELAAETATRKRTLSPFLTLATGTGPELKLTNTEFRSEFCLESLYLRSR